MMVLMFQREVAERIVAREDDEAYGRLAVLAELARRDQDPVRHFARGLRAAAEGHLVGGATGAARQRLSRATAGRSNRWRRPPSASAARCCGKASNRWRSIRPGWRRRRMSIRRGAPRPFRSSGFVAMARELADIRSYKIECCPKERTPWRCMRRQSLVKFDAPLCETIVDTPKPQGNEVLVRIERCGLCHSDLHIQDGYADLGGGKKLDTTRGMTLPFTLGHEIAGVVEEVGPDASKDLIGTKKAVFPWIGCGQCRDCRQRRREPLRQAALPRRLHRRRFRQPRAGAGRKIPAGLRSAAGQSGRNADVLGRDRLWRAEAAGRPPAAAQPAADRPRRRRHDGAFVRAGDVQAEHRGRRSEPGRARDRAEERRRGRLRSVRA